MYIIVGLGNPSEKYKGTKHNVGFDVIDEIAEQNAIKVNVSKHKALCGQGVIGGHKVLLAKPMTYMNLSGESVRAIADFYKVDFENQCIIVYDDTSLDVGQIRIRKKGSAGGHNGIKSIIQHMGTQEFIRIRLGIGKKPDKMDLANYVLSRFDNIERVKIGESIKEIAKACEMIVEKDVDLAMNRFNLAKNNE